MAKKQTFGTEGKKSSGDRRMAKVIVAKKTDREKYAYKEAMVEEGDVQNFIKDNRE